MSGPGWLAQRVLVCAGTGGVGKTTVAAAVGLEAARRGKRVLVLTIDPARRLADALGAGPLDHVEREVPRERLRRMGVPEGGALFAMMLDTKRTFDDVVARYAPDAETRDRVFANPIYQNLTDALAGSREYSAMEALHQIHARDEYDLIVLDTPPARHALEFLDAPRRLTGLLDAQILKLLIHPAAALGRASFRLFRVGSQAVLRLMERVSGFEFLTAISEFLLAFESMLDGFAARAREIESLLRGPECGFLLIAGADVEQGRRARAFWRRLHDEQVQVVGLVVNRVHVWPGEGPIPASGPAEREAAAAWLDAGLRALHPDWSRNVADAVVEVAARQASLARRDAAIVAELETALPMDAGSVRVVPLLSEDVHALEGLGRIAGHLFGGERHG